MTGEYIDLLNNPLLRVYDRDVSEYAKDLPSDARHPKVRSAHEALSNLYASLYGDKDVQQAASRIVDAWSRDFEANPERAHIRNAWVDLFEGKDPMSLWEESVAITVATRRGRWERLAAQLGIAAPAGFVAYRGVRGIAFVQGAVSAWESENENFTVLQHPLASWSLNAASAHRFASNPHASVVYAAAIPLVQTLADKWVDGGRFVIPYASQHEIIAGVGVSNGVSASTRQTRICYRNRWYSFDEREEVFSLLRRRPL